MEINLASIKGVKAVLCKRQEKERKSGLTTRRKFNCSEIDSYIATGQQSGPQPQTENEGCESHIAG